MSELLESTYGEADASVIVETAIAASEPKHLDADGKLVGVAVPRGGELTIVDITERLAKHRSTPPRASGTHSAATVQSFIDIVRRHDNADTLTIWVHPTSGSITAILNDHSTGQEPQWGDHRVQLNLIETDEWKRWATPEPHGLDGALVDQEKFAEHIQDGLTEIAEPPAAELLEIVQTMRGSTEASWKAGVRLVDGAVQMEYSEEMTTTAGRNQQVSVPAEFTLMLAPFIGENVAVLQARLRWRLKSGGLKIGYKLDNPERVVREVLEKIAERLRVEFPGDVYLGTPR